MKVEIDIANNSMETKVNIDNCLDLEDFKEKRPSSLNIQDFAGLVDLVGSCWSLNFLICIDIITFQTYLSEFVCFLD